MNNDTNFAVGNLQLFFGKLQLAASQLFKPIKRLLQRNKSCLVAVYAATISAVFIYSIKQ